MNDYRNFQSKTRRRKGSNFNKHCKGKQALKQKNNYNIVFSNKHKQIAQSKHAQQYHKFVNKTRSKEIKDVDPFIISHHYQSMKQIATNDGHGCYYHGSYSKNSSKMCNKKSFTCWTKNVSILQRMIQVRILLQRQ